MVLSSARAHPRFSSLPSADWSCPNKFYFGRGRIEELPLICQAEGVFNPLLITSHGLADKLLLKRVKNNLKAQGFALNVFENINALPTKTDIQTGLDCIRKNKCDGIIGFGNNHAIDAAKLMALAEILPDCLSEHSNIGENKNPNEEDIPRNILKILSIPTTPGSGAEMMPHSIIRNQLSGGIKIIGHSSMLSQAVIADPDFIDRLTPAQMAINALEALTHGIEAWCLPASDQLSDTIALEALAHIFSFLEETMEGGVEEKGRLMIAGAMAGVATQKGAGLTYLLAHALAPFAGVEPGLLKAILLPHILLFNEPAIGKRLAGLASFLNRPCNSIPEHIFNLREKNAISPANIRLTSKEIEDICLPLLNLPMVKNNPVRLNSKNLPKLVRKAFGVTV